MGEQVITVPSHNTAQDPVRGVCPVLETPFTSTGEIDHESFTSLIRHVAGTRVSSVMFPGFASEFYKLSDQERGTLTSTLLDVAGETAHLSVVVSVPDHATKLAVARAREAVGLGAAAINVLPPFQQSPSGDAVRGHVESIAEAVYPTPVIVQYAPAQTGTILAAPEIASMAAMHPNIRQVKVEATPPGAMISALAQQNPPLSAIIGYAGVQMIDALRRGAVAVQPGCSFVEVYQEIWEVWSDGRQDEATELHRQLLPYISYWMQSVELIIAAEKRISRLRGLIREEVCRAPMRELDRHECAAIDRFLETYSRLFSAEPNSR